MDFRLRNGEDLHRQWPRSFFIPPRDEREALGPGDLAKLYFEVVGPADDMPGAERMWVQVVERAGDDYTRTLESQPQVISTIQPGDRVTFRPEHVIALQEDAPMLAQRAVVSRRSHTADARPRFVYRDTPLSDSDSGWCVLVGDETQEELDDPANGLAQPLGFVVDRWPELRAVFETGEVGSEWTWDDATTAYVPLHR